ncbi:Uncharacterized protein PECH_002051 [Penicillium ucsense]|uniref:Stc1 domain-containing protein n=1 Tax=Penicillium ucsense TaxID=2839758 RepID=A0A8J8WJ38_9EURO|nr:Uncharacterized protein PECM_002614 [Penicillium ucsense]KAF7738014.1 Uncharacterized protein PECH_002051 [Penicillium ucsense]
METIKLPDTITCALCERQLPLERFTPSALKRLRTMIVQKGVGSLKDQQIARCDGCGTQSRPELHCMSCNQVRPINEFAHTQRQFDQPVCLPCQDNLQLDERDKLASNQVGGGLIEADVEQDIDDRSDPMAVFPMDIDGAQQDIPQESGLGETAAGPALQESDENALTSQTRMATLTAESSRVAPRPPQKIIQDMELELLFE